jgi:hypothetical protein
MEVGDRVKTKHKFLTDGVIVRVIPYVGYIVKLDEKAPNEYSHNTKNEVLMYANELELEK